MTLLSIILLCMAAAALVVVVLDEYAGTKIVTSIFAIPSAQTSSRSPAPAWQLAFKGSSIGFGIAAMVTVAYVTANDKPVPQVDVQSVNVLTAVHAPPELKEAVAIALQQKVSQVTQVAIITKMNDKPTTEQISSNISAGDSYFARKSYDQALTAYDQACVASNADACSKAGILYYTGLGTSDQKVDVRAGNTAYALACKLGRSKACLDLGIVYETGAPNLPSDQSMALDYYQIACTNQDPVGCGRFSTLQQRIALTVPVPNGDH